MLPNLDFNKLLDAINNDPVLTRRGRYYDACFGLDVDSSLMIFEVEDGCVTAIGADHAAVKPQFMIRMGSDSWHRFCTASPRPGYHDLSAMIDRGNAAFEGEIKPWLSNMLYVKGVIDHVRDLEATGLS